MISSLVSNGFDPLGDRYLLGSVGSIVSMNRFCVSVSADVKPQAMRSFCPSSTIGAPGMVPPFNDPLGVTMRARYQRIGAPRSRCGSLARIGLPVVVRAPEIAHSLEAPCAKGDQRAS